ncbi:MAG: DUF1844 domain-containing protein [Thermoanaerobaculaceae bacterium]
MTNDESSKKQVKVIDRRWFTPEGELREGLPETPPQKPAQDSPPASPTVPPEEPGAQKSGRVHFPNRLTFLDLVDFFAQQALALLSGQIPGRGKDPETARYFIDLLGVLQEKTSGRLTPEEARYIDEVLFQLRAVYVQSTR